MVADLAVDSVVENALRALEGGADAVLAVDWTAPGSEELLEGLRRMERVMRRLPAARCASAAEIKSRGLAAQHGCRSNQAFLRQLLGWSAGEAGSCLAQADDLVGGRSLSTGERLPPRFPVLADAVAAGAVSPEQVRLIRHTLTRIPADVDPATRAKAEAKLVEVARVLDPDQLRKACARLLCYLDPDGSLGSTEKERQAKRGFSIGRQDRHGMYPVHGLLEPETGALLKAALEPLAAPRHTAEERDTRTSAQRMHDAVRDAAKILLGSGRLPSQSGVPATLLLITTLDDLERRTGVAATGHGGLLPTEDVIRLAANAGGGADRVRHRRRPPLARPHPQVGVAAAAAALSGDGQGLRLSRLRRARDAV